MSTKCGPSIVDANLVVYLDAANPKSYSKYGINKWGDMGKNQYHFSRWGSGTVLDQQAYTFPGTVDDYFSSSVFAGPVNELTVEMWVLPDNTASGDMLYSFVSSNSTMIRHSLSNQESLTISGPLSSIDTNVSILDGTWKHVVRTSLRSTGAEKLYVNNELVADEILDPAVGFSSSGLILLGQKPDSSGILQVEFSYKGKIAVFKLYNAVLSSEDVKQNFNALNGRFYL